MIALKKIYEGVLGGKMVIFKCKMCGGDLNIVDGVTIAECDYCGTKQTVPKSMDLNMQNLFNRANSLRMRGDFDKAAEIYEKIVQADNEQSEAFWGLILCKYGIEYVDDPATFKKIPTCHRASFDSIISDDDYKSALENADILQRAIYEEQAKEIDRIQKDILVLVQNEEKYDVFICYKETDENGKRTQDSVIANDIYYELIREGYKVFYAAITLEDKLGSAYEPTIFAALNSAKVMLVLGTKPEYFNAVWVKNEWSRFLKIIKNDRSKYIFPCYRDMDAYDLPEEFSHLQSQDMSKIGFINDVVRGIKKVIVKDDPKLSTVVEKKVMTDVNANVDSLLKRVFMFLENAQWDDANTYCEKVLDIDPENAKAYLGKFMVERQIKKQEELENAVNLNFGTQNFTNALKFADEELKTLLKSCINSCEQYARKSYQQWYDSYIKISEESEPDIVSSLCDLQRDLVKVRAELNEIEKAPVSSQENIFELEKNKKMLVDKTNEKQNIKQRIHEKQIYLETLGFFSISEKKNVKNQILELEQQIIHIDGEISNMNRKKKSLEDLLSTQYSVEEKNKMLQEKNTIIEEIEKNIEEGVLKLKKFEYCGDLYRKNNTVSILACLDYESEEFFKSVAHKSRYNNEEYRKLLDSIRDVLVEDISESGLTLAGIMKKLENRYAINVTSPAVNYMLRYLIADGTVKEIRVKKVPYFSLNFKD